MLLKRGIWMSETRTSKFSEGDTVVYKGPYETLWGDVVKCGIFR